jgi:predicted PurR-regulated permease PerM
MAPATRIEAQLRRILFMNEQLPVRRDLTHLILLLLFVCLLIAATVWTLLPFLVSFLWASVIVIATWPFLENLKSRLRSRKLAVIIVSLLLVCVFLIPLMLAILTIARGASDIAARVQSFDSVAVPPPPKSLARIPLVGAKITREWQTFASLSPEERSSIAAPYAKKALLWFAAQAGNTPLIVVHILITIIISIILYANGEGFREAILSFARRLAAKQGEEIAILAARAVRAVVLGVVVTALIQTAISGVALSITGVPAAGLLTAVILILCLAQLGPILVLIPAVIWNYWSGHAALGTVLLVLSLVAVTIDNFIRPLLIRKGIDLPLLLIFAGVIGGLIGFGVIGLFIGPVILAISHTLLRAWVSGNPQGSGQGQVIQESGSHNGPAALSGGSTQGN